MKNNMVWGGLLAVTLVVSVACNQKKEVSLTVDDIERIKTEIQNAENHFADIYNKGNADSLFYYADDAVSYFNNQNPIVGKAAIHEFINGELENFPKGAKITYETKEVHVSSDANQVLEIGTFLMVDSTQTKIRGGKYFSLFEKHDGKYLCVRDMGNSDPMEE
jgi:ketosteroid isomerase-like protein